MKFVYFAAALMLAVTFSVPSVQAQDHMMMDHGAHMAAPVHAQPAQAKKCACCEAGTCPMQGMQHDMQAMSGTAPEKAWEKKSDEAMKQMHLHMAQPYTGDADADFIRGMIPHHQGAVEMARIVLQHGDDEEAKELARRIIVAQKGEIAWMQRWLRKRQIPETGAFDFNR